MRRVYLDTCCLNRPSDDQRQPRVRLEAEAVLVVLVAVEREDVEMLGSAVLQAEVNRNPDAELRQRASGLLHAATRWMSLEPADVARGQALARLANLSAFDALHIALAERGQADVLLTTDDRLVRRAARHAPSLGVVVQNPLAWVARNLPVGRDQDG